MWPLLASIRWKSTVEMIQKCASLHGRIHRYGMVCKALPYHTETWFVLLSPWSVSAIFLGGALNSTEEGEVPESVQVHPCLGLLGRLLNTLWSPCGAVKAEHTLPVWHLCSPTIQFLCLRLICHWRLEPPRASTSHASWRRLSIMLLYASLLNTSYVAAAAD